MADKTFHSIKFPGLPDTYKIPDIVNEYSPSSAYAVGDYALKDGKTYKCTTAIASSGEAWNTAHWTEVKVGNDLQGEVADLKSAVNKQDLFHEEIPDTTQTYTFSNGSVSQVIHSRNSAAVRTDTFTYGSSTITEVRTLDTGETLTIITNLLTLETTVTYTAA